MTIPIFRRDDVEAGIVHYLPAGSRTFDTRTGEFCALEPGIYTHVTDARTDNELRRLFSEA